MTPAARLSAAIEILDDILEGTAAEKALTNWARHSRFAGSKDRAAVRDHVFSALRCKRSYGHLGGAGTGRGIVLGLLRAQGMPPADMFTGEGHAPTPMSDEEAAYSATPAGNVALDCPDWIAPLLQASLGDDFAAVCHALQHRAPVFLRVNPRMGSREQAITVLAAENITAVAHPLSETALEVTQNPRRVHLSEPYNEGHVELQDAASQAVVDLLPISEGDRVLDYCAGGGGKVLAMAARIEARYFAHDANPKRMQDLAARATRARAFISELPSEEVAEAAPFDLVLCDVPCSGSGAWRRSPAGKWGFDQEQLDDLRQTQQEILGAAAGLVAPSGVLAYTTCSLLDAENSEQIARFLAAHSDWTCTAQHRFTPLDGGDGFFCALLTR
ncbi:MAG: RsmB/NOP family class I SAM-dependent RNA methyltransferase [Marinosulfonomonas sp.]|nr:RsmB/NOP family class I SAM-dependent RNA methyltransferase [Marinosulfonomonas sp.]